MTLSQIATLLVLVGVVVALASDKVRADVAALGGAAALGLLGIARLEDLQAGFASPAVIAIGALFVLVRALERTGVIALLIRYAARLAASMGAKALPLIIGFCGSLSGFLNNTPLVILAAPVLEHMGHKTGVAPKKLLLPLSYASILGGACTLIGTSTNLLVDDMAQKAGLFPFHIFEITGVGLAVAIVGGLYLLFVAPRLITGGGEQPQELHDASDQPLRPKAAMAALLVFFLVLGGAMGGLPIALVAFVGAVIVVAGRILSPEDAYSALRPQVLLIICGMLVVGSALDRTGLAVQATQGLSRLADWAGPLVALAAIYAVTSILTEILSNAGVAVLVTPLAIGLAQNMGVDPRPFAVAVMMAASASFATPFGYQTNTIVYQMGGYSYFDFVKVGLPLNILAGVVAVVTIPYFFPF